MPTDARITALAAAVRDRQTVTPAGEIIAEPIEGVMVRAARTITDDRGTMCELFNPAWGFTEEPLVYAYQATIRPGVVKGWVVHLESDDRLFFAGGSVRVVLYDAREGSSSEGQLNVLYFDEHNRGLLRIPRRVFHAVQNVGSTDATFVNLPTRAYDHESPDKYRLPLTTEAIPYRF